MPLRLLVINRVACARGSSTVKTGSGFCGSAGTNDQVANDSKWILKCELPIRVDHIRGVEDPISSTHNYAICGAARQVRSWARSFCNKDRPGFAGTHFARGIPAGRLRDQNWRSGYHARLADRNIPSAAQRWP